MYLGYFWQISNTNFFFENHEFFCFFVQKILIILIFHDLIQNSRVPTVARPI